MQEGATTATADEAVRLARASGELKSTSYELFMVLVSLLSVLNFALYVVPFVDGPIQAVALAVDGILAAIFAADFLFRFLTVRSKTQYFVHRFGWADLLAAVPLWGAFRLFRVARVWRLFRGVGRDRLVTELYVSRPATTFFATMFLVLVVIEFAGMGVYYAEAGARGANIESGGDAVWWGLVTITTVGYGDEYPVTHWGRIIGSLFLFAGIGLFSVLTGFIANIFLAPREPRSKRIRQRLSGVESQMADLRHLLDEQDARSKQIREKLRDLELTIHRPSVAGEEPGRVPGPDRPSGGD